MGQTTRIQKTIKAYKGDAARAQSAILEAINSWPRREVTVNAKVYEYLIDIAQLQALVAAIEQILRTGEGPKAARQAAEASYKEGTAKAAANLAAITSDYPRTVLQRLGDQQVLKRAAIAGSRVFEEMVGFAGDTAKSLSRVLYDAVALGENPRNTARKIRSQFGVSIMRATRIARTEITMALRRGRWDEARDAEERFGLKVMVLHNSALIPGRTRESHAARHGQLFTVQEQAEWYASDANGINCLCSSTEITIGPNGDPLVGGKLIGRMQEAKIGFLKTQPKTGDG